ncbi:MAG: 5'-3' exonuclease H3TH domain-containing protein, partial [Eubacteriales bacterium]|nr:5'-3' exonuclease H3TH domain-containing protein [Eubacteriales bacterium]
MKRILLVDANSIINRAYYGMAHSSALTNSKGEAVGAVYTFMVMLLKQLERQDYDALACCFDRKEKTFRHKRYDGYKAQRKAADPELIAQIGILKDLLEASGVSVVSLAGYEADDLIGTLARQAHEAGLAVDIYSGDRDDFQLLKAGVEQIYPSRRGDITISVENLGEHFYGLRADQVVDFKAIMGDSSDNIPGIKGLGEKSAQALLNEYDNLDAVYDSLDEIKGAMRKKLDSGRELAYLSRELATIDCDVPLDFGIDDL